MAGFATIHFKKNWRKFQWIRANRRGEAQGHVADHGTAADRELVGHLQRRRRVSVSIDAFAQIGPNPKLLGGWRAVRSGVVLLPA